MSPNTLRSYRDAMALLLRFIAQDAGRPIETLDIPDLSAVRITPGFCFFWKQSVTMG